MISFQWLQKDTCIIDVAHKGCVAPRGTFLQKGTRICSASQGSVARRVKPSVLQYNERQKAAPVAAPISLTEAFLCQPLSSSPLPCFRQPPVFCLILGDLASCGIDYALIS